MSIIKIKALQKRTRIQVIVRRKKNGII